MVNWERCHFDWWSELPTSFITWICKAQAPPKHTRSARMSLSCWLKLRSVIVRISIRATPFSSGSNRSWLLKSKSTDVLSRRWKQYSMPVAVSWRILGIGMNYFTDLIRHLIYVILLILPLAYHRAWMYIPFTAMTMSVSLNTSSALSFLSGFAIIQHFLLFGKQPKSGPRVLNMSL